MVDLLSGERPALSAAPSHLLRAIAGWFAAQKLRRSRRVALLSLLEFEQSRLDDLGINRQDLFEALESPSQLPGLRLARKRAESARNWLDR